MSENRIQQLTSPDLITKQVERGNKYITYEFVIAPNSFPSNEPPILDYINGYIKDTVQFNIVMSKSITGFVQNSEA